MISDLFDRDIVPIFLSSDYVFEGEKGFYDELDEKVPVNVYGKHKKIVEDFLIQSKRKYVVARLSKVYGILPGDGTILTTWIEMLKEGDVINAAHDNILSPTYIHDLAKAILIIIRSGLTGSYNLAAPDAYSRLQLAELVKSRLGIENGKIVPCSIRDFQFDDKRPLNTSLNSMKFCDFAKFRFSRVEDNIDKIKIA